MERGWNADIEQTTIDTLDTKGRWKMEDRRWKWKVKWNEDGTQITLMEHLPAVAAAQVGIYADF